MTQTGRRGVPAVARRALITLVGHLENDSPGAAAPRRDIERAHVDDTPSAVPWPVASAAR